MEVAESVAALQSWRRAADGTVGFVPTMGYLHDGHLALVRRAAAENDRVTVSVFVNPAQFGPGEDFARYPRDPERDLALLRAGGADLAFLPPGEEVYPPGFSTWIDVEGLTERLEGAARPGHFRGMATVVARLFGLVRPARAYFGQKDAQQVAVVRRLVADLSLPLEVVAVPTVRDPDGLALSSRNVFLSEADRHSALSLSRGLFRARALHEDGERDAMPLRAAVEATLAADTGVVPEYISLVDAATFAELMIVDRPAVLAVAARVGTTRLIDNVPLGGNGRA